MKRWSYRERKTRRHACKELQAEVWDQRQRASELLASNERRILEMGGDLTGAAHHIAKTVGGIRRPRDAELSVIHLWDWHRVPGVLCKPDGINFDANLPIVEGVLADEIAIARLSLLNAK